MQATDNMVQINEIFTSIEGEGVFFGTKTLFVRLSGCHLRCYWCDTKYALPMDSGTSYSISDAKDKIQKSLKPSTYKVNFTGGEPLLQHKALAELAAFIKKKGIKTYLESSCFDAHRFASVISNIDICKIEFKLRESRVIADKYYDNLLENELECLKLAISWRKTTYIKIVVTGSTDIHEFRDLVFKIFKIAKITDIAGFIIQPSYNVNEPTVDRLFEFYDTVYPIYSDVRIVPQLHKIIGAR